MDNTFSTKMKTFVALFFLCILTSVVTAQTEKDSLIQFGKIAARIQHPTLKAWLQSVAARLVLQTELENDATLKETRQAYQTYLNSLIAINIAECPKTIQNDFNSHTKAAISMLHFYETLPQDGFELFTDYALKIYRGQTTPNTADIKKEGYSTLADFKRTMEILKVETLKDIQDKDVTPSDKKLLEDANDLLP